MTITVLLDPAQMPSRSMDQQTFDNSMAALVANLPTLGAQINATTANLNSIAAGGAYAIPYVFSTSVLDVDPGIGKMQLDSPTQSSATGFRVDLIGSNGKDYTATLGSFGASTSAVKGTVRIVKMTDPSKFLVLNIASQLVISGYRNHSATVVETSGGNPFADGDAVMLFFQRTGDKGDTGLTGAPGSLSLLASYTVSTAVAQIDFLTLFSDTYNKYVVEVEGIYPSTSSTQTLCVRLAAGGAVDTGTTYNGFSADAVLMTGSQTQLTLPTQLSNLANGEGTFSMAIRNARSTSRSKSIGVEGRLQNFAVMQEGGWTNLAAASGFRLYFSGINIGGGTVRVYGVKA